jgi:hypothetical protein
MKIQKSTIRLSYKSVPLALFVLAVLSFGILIPKLGLYWDDWETILVLKLYPLSTFWNYFQGNRPLAGWTYFLFGPLLGASPLNWQILSLLLRWLTVTAMWWVFTRVWPMRKAGITLAAFLFMVYPVFMQQSIAVSYHQHWIAYLMYFLSLACMILSIQKPRWYWGLTALGLICMLLHLTILEYFTGVEFLRPLILFLIVKPEEVKPLKKLGEVLKKWLPYLVGLIAFTLIRLSISSQLTDDPNRPKLIFNFFQAPFKTLINLARISIQDIIFVLASSWNKTLLPTYFDLSQRTNILFWGLSAICGIAFIVYFIFLHPDDKSSENSDGLKSFFGIGLAATILGPVPIWLTERQASVPGLFADRFAMAAMFGASLLVVALLDWLSPDRIKKGVLVGVLITLAVNTHLQTANSYRWSWTEQMRTYWQLYWRAPYIEPDTLLLSDTELFSYVFPTFSFNLLYNNPPDSTTGAYVFNYAGRGFKPDPTKPDMGIIIDSIYRNFRFHASGSNSLVLYHSSEETANCLWVLNQEDEETPYLPEAIHTALPASNFTRIRPEPISSTYPAREIFGSEPAHTWCYYYEKAALAQQQRDWAKIVQLGEEAIGKGYTPDVSQANSPHEWIPFIEGYVYQNRWEDAASFTITTSHMDQNYKKTLCSLWKRLEAETPQAEQKPEALQSVKSGLSCGD